MKLVKVQSKTILDNTGNTIDLPILLVEKNGEIDLLWSLHRYFLQKSIKSSSWRNRLIQGVSLLLEYIETNYYCFSDPKDVFKSFTDAVYAGTIGEYGKDPSGLYWLPKRTETAQKILFELSEYSDWRPSNERTV